MRALFLPRPALLAAMMLVPAALPVAAQTASGTISASVTVDPPPLTVTGVQDLAFGSHFADDGVVQNSLDGEWFVDGAEGTTVSLSFSILPTTLDLVGASSLPLTYGIESMGVYCDDGLGNVTGVYVDPATGYSGCLKPVGGPILVELGPPLNSSSKVSVDLTGASAGTYTAVIELTATVM